MINGYRVEYRENRNEVCIIPDTSIPMDDFIELGKMYINLGYKWWLPADERQGYRFCKEKRENDN
jgi:hypothetical protein